MSLVSRTSELVAVQSSFAGSSIPRAEVAGLALSARQVESLDTKWEDVDPLRLLPANVVVPGGSLHHTSVQCGPGFAAGDPAAAWDSSAAPVLDFLKPHFAHNLGRRGNPPLLAGDLCLVECRAGGGAGGGHTGLAIVPVTAAREEPQYPVGVAARLQSSLQHDFTAARHCSVSVLLQLSSTAVSSLSLQYRLESQEPGTRLTGNTGAQLF